jgi:hypothetical protein
MLTIDNILDSKVNYTVHCWKLLAVLRAELERDENRTYWRNGHDRLAFDRAVAAE